MLLGVYLSIPNLLNLFFLYWISKLKIVFKPLSFIIAILTQSVNLEFLEVCFLKNVQTFPS
ncbi:hypothetical protein A3H81_01170 [Candidatus Daviesbacteria bacterium RIFCSPLOWO2_02_FULL_38_18]|nr:MAG: hypothetical protein A3H81_01170 [Candidatus Daviesbacteria bacterium RIFCSPLOWO2_02_FULL_38_18]HCB22871.1 hypothetical protein [Candidatus Daviesbacteria bacterium]